jgi:hypothetical protein
MKFHLSKKVPLLFFVINFEIRPVIFIGDPAFQKGFFVMLLHLLNNFSGNRGIKERK